MTSEWVGPVVTGLVGACGIAGTLVSMRIQQRTQLRIAVDQQRSRVGEILHAGRLAAYARYALLVRQLIDQSSATAEFSSGDDRLATTLAEKRSLNAELRRAETEVEILGSDDVRHQLRIAQSAISSYTRLDEQNMPTARDVVEHTNRVEYARAALVNSMKRDLDNLWLLG